MKNVLIATCLMAYTDEYGRTCIIVFNAVLWFVLIMDHLIINTNRIWMTVITGLNYPFDGNRKLGIAHENVFIPFCTDVTRVYFDSIVSTQP